MTTAASIHYTNNQLMAADGDSDDEQIDSHQHDSQHAMNMNINELQEDEDYFTLLSDDPLYDTLHDDDDDANTAAANNNLDSTQLFQLLDLPASLHHDKNNNATTTATAVGYPVGGMRRVSSCYFSIASNGSGINGTRSADALDNHNIMNNINNMADNEQLTPSIQILFQHDILMNTFTYLDATSLASFSETCKRCNFECFYFLELSLQRALLVSNTANNEIGNHCVNEEGDDNNVNNNNSSDELMIAGTGVITRLAQRNMTQARHIVQVYLDSNSSIRGMPVMYSLRYLRQMIRLHYQNNNNDGGENGGLNENDNEHGNNDEVMPNHQQLVSTQQQQQQQDGMISTARNMALLFTFLGAAYKYQHGGGGGDAVMPNLDDETIELCKNMMIRLGVAAGGMGSFLRAMKEHHAMQHQLGRVEGGIDDGESERRGDDNNGGGGGEMIVDQQESEEVADQVAERDNVEILEPNSHPSNVQNQQEQQQEQHQQDGMKATARNMALLLTLLGAAYKVNSGEIHIDEETMEVAKNTMIKLGLAGSLVKAGQMTIVKKERGEHSDSDGEEIQMRGDGDGGEEEQDVIMGDDATDHDEVQRRNDRSSSMGSLEDLSNMIKHPSAIASRLYNAFQSPNSTTTNLDSVGEQGGSSNSLVDERVNETPGRRRHRGKRSHFVRINESGEEKEDDADVKMGGESIAEPPTLEDMNYAMDHPFSTNPYDHLSTKIEPKKPPNDAGPSFLPFKMTPFQPLWAISEPDTVTSPSGCIGAYANAVKSAASEVTRLVKEERRANFEALSEGEQMELGIRFIDACTSDDKIDIVKDILQNQKNMDVDRFFIGQDATETCALHAAAFNGAEKVLEFLCGGIDENDPSKDCGLCDVNVTDANGWTALHFAAGANSVLSVRILAEHGAKLTVEAGNGYTPYHWAERLSNEEVALELESLGADNRFVASWMFGSSSGSSGDRMVPFVSYLAQQFFGR